MKLGIIGLTSSGKTTLFNSLSKAKGSGYRNMSGRKRPNIKIVPVPDERLEKLEQIFKPKKKTPAYIEFVDIAGLEKSGMGAGNQFLPNIREVDALVHVVRCYESSSNIPLNDIEVINLELIVSDLESIEKRMKTIEKQTRNITTQIKTEAKILKKIMEGMEKGQPSRNIGLLPQEIKAIKSMGLLTLKPFIYCANIAESDIGKDEGKLPFIRDIKQYAQKEKSEVLTVCAKIEEEISQLEPDDKEAFMQDLGIRESSLDKLVKSSYKILGLISFLTAGSDEVRAWTIKKGDKAPSAASIIHSDIERGFIRAETISFDKFIEAGSFTKAKEKGLLRSEGKQYSVNDGDIINFRFNV
jgi:GTP-binding protein YchF